VEGKRLRVTYYNYRQQRECISLTQGADMSRILSEQLENVCQQRNLTLAKNHLKTVKNKKDVTDAEIQTAKDKLERVKIKASIATDALRRAGLSKGAM